MAGSNEQGLARGATTGENPTTDPATGDATAASSVSADSRPSAAPLLAPVGDERFAELLARFADHSMSREEFDGLGEERLPQGMGRDETWRALSQIRCSQAVHYRDPLFVNGARMDDWFYPTHRINHLLRELCMRTLGGSKLDRALSERHGRRLVARSLVEETVATLRCDGLAIDEEEARDVISGSRQPTGPVERLAVNMHGLLVRMLEESTTPRITPELVQGM